jgi:hypothetical protein
MHPILDTNKWHEFELGLKFEFGTWTLFGCWSVLVVIKVGMKSTSVGLVSPFLGTAWACILCFF